MRCLPSSTDCRPISREASRPPALRLAGTYCHRIGKNYRPKLTCTPTAVPTGAVEAEAKRFEADPASLTVYVLRRSWGVASVALPVTVEGEASGTTIPE